MAYQELKMKWTGVCPLVVHNGQLADPLNPHAKAMKEISGKRNKTDADHEELARREWFGGLYLGPDGPCIPFSAIEASLIGGAKKSKQGTAAKQGILVEQNPAIEYDGPRDPKEMWESGNFKLTVGVKVGTSRVMRTRPIFNEWSISPVVLYEPSVVSAEDIIRFAKAAGEQCGFCDWRPRYGRFTVERVDG